MIIDFHAHCFPERIAKMAMNKLSFLSGGLLNYTDGTKQGLIKAMDKASVDKAVALNIATNPTQQTNVNNFAYEINKDEKIIAFGSIHPKSQNALYELERIKSLGLKGVKFHPDYQGFFVDDEKMKPIYKKISKLGLITIFHAGLDFAFAPPYKATPERLEKALLWFDSPVIAAHWGALGCADEVLKRLCGKDIWIDTSFGLGQLPKYYAQKIIEKHTADKILFGSDCPWHTAEMELRLLSTLSLSKNDYEKITHQNAEKLLNI